MKSSSMGERKIILRTNKILGSRVEGLVFWIQGLGLRASHCPGQPHNPEPIVVRYCQDHAH